MPLVQPGDPPLNPTGKQAPVELRRARMQLTWALLDMGQSPCDLPGYEGKTFFAAGIDTLFRLYVAGEEWAVKEVHNRCFGRVPLDVDAAITVGRTAAPDSTPDELLARLDMLRDEARHLLAAPVAEGSSPLPETVAVGGRTLPAKEDE